MVGCVLLNAAFKCEDYRKVNALFDATDWFTGPTDDMMVITEKLEVWDYLAKLPREERPGPDFFARISKKSVDTE